MKKIVKNRIFSS